MENGKAKPEQQYGEAVVEKKKRKRGEEAGDTTQNRIRCRVETAKADHIC